MEIEELKRDAEKGDTDAQYKLAEKYYNGDEVTKNVERAISLYEKSAEQGDSSSMYALALHYCGMWKSENCDSSAEKAKYWGEKAKAAGHAIASKCLKGLGIHYP